MREPGPPPAGARPRLLVAAVWVVALAVAAAQAWAFRHRFNPDGISYLDLADAWREGRALESVNGHWSPAYPAFLALALAVAPASADELTVVHLANLVAFAAALGALHLLLRTLASTRRERLGAAPAGWAPLPERAFVAAGLAIGACLLLRTTSLRLVTPDLLLVTPVLLAASALVRVVSGTGGLGAAVGLGAALGLGYLTKSVLFPLSLAVLLAALLVGGPRGGRRRAAIAAVAFAVVAAPQVVGLSAARGRLAFSDSSWLSVLWLQKEVPFVHWRGGPAEAGVPDRPPRLACDDPAVLEFATETPWTYALWGDPAPWHLGGDSTTTVRATLEVTQRSGGELLALVESLLGVLAPLLLLASLRGSQGGLAAVARRQWPLLLPVLAAAALYAPFRVEARFFGGFLTLLAVAFLDTAALPEAALGRRGAGTAVAGTLLLLAALVVRPTAVEAVDLVVSPEAPEHEAVRRALAAAGVEGGGAPVAVVGDGLRAYWARHAGLRIVADVLVPPDGPTAWAADPVRRACVRDGLRSAGVSLVFAAVDGEEAPPPPWTRLPGTTLALLDLR